MEIVLIVVLAVGAGAAYVCLKEWRKRRGPPDDVLTAVLRGGPYDSIIFEIEERQTQISAKADLFTGQRPPEVTYRYTGAQDENGHAIFGPGPA